MVQGCERSGVGLGVPNDWGDTMMTSLWVGSLSQNLDQWTMRQSSLELQLMIKQTPNNVSMGLGPLFSQPSSHTYQGGGPPWKNVGATFGFWRYDRMGSWQACGADG